MRMFVKRLTQRPVLDETGRLCADIIEIVDKIEASGKDPITELKKCKDYLDSSLEYMNRNRRIYTAKDLYSKNKFKGGTRASLRYMRDELQKIISCLAVKKLESMMPD